MRIRQQRLRAFSFAVPSDNDVIEQSMMDAVHSFPPSADT
jgi:hypothetical protein